MPSTLTWILISLSIPECFVQSPEDCLDSSGVYHPSPATWSNANATCADEDKHLVDDETVVSECVFSQQVYNEVWTGFVYDVGDVHTYIHENFSVSQWVVGVVNFSSQFSIYNASFGNDSFGNDSFGPSWEAVEIIGEPDSYPFYGNTGAWSQEYEGLGYEYIVVEFEEPLYITHIDIFETYNAGGITSIKAQKSNGDWYVVWETDAVQVINTSRIFSPEFEMLQFRSDTLRIEVDTSASQSFVDIDAVEMSGYPFLAAMSKTRKCNIHYVERELTCSLRQCNNSAVCNRKEYMVDITSTRQANILADQTKIQMTNGVRMDGVSPEMVCMFAYLNWTDIGLGFDHCDTMRPYICVDGKNQMTPVLTSTAPDTTTITTTSTSSTTTPPTSQMPATTTTSTAAPTTTTSAVNPVSKISISTDGTKGTTQNGSQNSEQAGSDDTGNLSTGIIIGIAGGALVVCVLIIVFCLLYKRRQRSPKPKPKLPNLPPNFENSGYVSSDNLGRKEHPKLQNLPPTFVNSGYVSSQNLGTEEHVYMELEDTARTASAPNMYSAGINTVSGGDAYLEPIQSGKLNSGQQLGKAKQRLKVSAPYDHISKPTGETSHQYQTVYSHIPHSNDRYYSQA